jgi:hypothetical protein
MSVLTAHEAEMFSVAATNKTISRLERERDKAQAKNARVYERLCWIAALHENKQAEAAQAALKVLLDQWGTL